MSEGMRKAMLGLSVLAGDPVAKAELDADPAYQAFQAKTKARDAEAIEAGYSKWYDNIPTSAFGDLPSIDRLTATERTQILRKLGEFSKDAYKAGYNQGSLVVAGDLLKAILSPSKRQEPKDEPEVAASRRRSACGGDYFGVGRFPYGD